MTEPDASNWSSGVQGACELPVDLPRLSVTDFDRLASFLGAHLGVHLGPTKKIMLESRLTRRLLALGFRDFSTYVERFFDPAWQEQEIGPLVDLVTTHHTFFFREDEHMQALASTMVPELKARHSHLYVWSGACSTGEEAYSIGMTLADIAGKNRLEFTVLGTDVSERVVEVARRAVYQAADVQGIPEALARKYLMRSKNPGRGLVRVVPELRRHVHFATLNLSVPFEIKPAPQVVFLRNVLIYFDREGTRELLGRVVEQLEIGGYLVLSLTESADGLGLPLQRTGRSIYRKLR